MGARGLSKSKFCTGLQCLRQLWWRVHEPDAPEHAGVPVIGAALQLVAARKRDPLAEQARAVLERRATERRG